MYQVRDNVKKFGINRLVSSGIYKAAFPLHDVSQMAKMKYSSVKREGVIFLTLSFFFHTMKMPTARL